jgi:hypothetical protein
MKSNHAFSALISLLAVLCLSACQSQTGEVAAPQSSCKIKTFSSSYTTSPATNGSAGQSETVYEYDALDNLTRTSTSTKSKNNNDAFQLNESIITIFSYDSAGYLSKKTEQHDRQDAGRNTKTNTNTSYVYGNDKKLTTATETKSGNITQTTIYRYEYDNAGKVSKFITETGDQKTTHTYANGELTAVTQRGANGADLQIYTVTNGIVTKQAQSVSNYTTYAYNNQRRLTKSEQFVDGKLNYYYEMSPIEAKPATESLPSFKGHPIISPLTGKTGLFDVFKFYALINNTMTQMNESTYKYSVNAKGFVASTILANKVLDKTPYTTNVTETYDYRDCQ